MSNGKKSQEEEEEEVEEERLRVYRQKYTKISLSFFEVHHPVRFWCIRINESQIFESLIVLVILVNCVFLALMQPGKPHDQGMNRIVAKSELVFTIIFTLEMLIRIIARGFIAGDTDCEQQGDKVKVYLKDGWNVLDFLVVISSLIGLIPSLNSNFSSLRTIRLLRPLRTITAVPSMRLLVSTLIGSVPMIGNVLLLFLLLFVIFGILGLELFMGKLRNRCFEVDEFGNKLPFGNGTELELIDTVCSVSSSGYQCQESQQCLEFENPNFGVTSFDNIFNSCITIFQCITLEGWTSVMYMIMDAVGGWTFIYFFSMIILGSFLVLNLALGVITDMYETTRQDIEKEEEVNNNCQQEEGRTTYDSDKGQTLTTTITISAAVQQDREEALNISAVCLSLSNKWWFQALFIVLILANTILLSLEFHGMSDGYKQRLRIVNIIISVLFALEVIVKCCGMGFRLYLSDRFNMFDIVVVVASLVELVFSSSGSLSAFRSVRLLRLLKLLKQWRSLQQFLQVLANTMKQMNNIVLILLLTIFIYALLGMQLFGGKYMDEGDDKPRHNYDTFFWACITIFQVLTGEDWNSVMYDGIRVTSTWSALYFISLVILGNFVVLNLFLAVLLSNFGHIGTEESSTQDSQTDCLQQDNNDPDGTFRQLTTWARQTFQRAFLLSDHEHQFSFRDNSKHWSQRLSINSSSKSLFCLQPFNPVRQFIFGIADDVRFEWTIIAVIVLSSIALAIETPFISTSLRRTLTYFEYVFTAIFLLEMVIKVVAFGFLLHKGAYLRDPWNILDFIVLAFSVVNLAFSKLELRWVRSLRAIRVLRPLRVINKIPELKVVVNALILSIPSLGHVLVIGILFWLIFGILGMNLFMGVFYSCSAASCCSDLSNTTSCVEVTGVSDCVGFDLDSGSECQWSNADNNFDNIFASVLTLFEISTTEGWTAVMYQGIDATGVDSQPVRDHRPIRAFYFLAFMVLGSFFFLNLFVGIILDNFAQQRQNSGSAFMTESQRAWVEMQKRALSAKPKTKKFVAKGALNQLLYKQITHPRFEYIILFCIGCNTVILSLQYYGQSAGYLRALEVLNLVFTIIFAAEAALKMFVFGIGYYLSDSWNLFDLAVVLVSIAMLFTDADAGTSSLRVLRVARILRLVKGLKGLRTLVATLWISIPTLMNVVVLTFLVFFVFAVLGVQLFGTIKLQENLNRHANFQNFRNAMMILFRMSTGESWNAIMYDCMVQPPDCDPSLHPYCKGVDGLEVHGVVERECSGPNVWVSDVNNCGISAAPMFFVMFTVCGAFIMLNLVVAVVLENFSISKTNEEYKIGVEDIEEFSKVWSEFDPDGVGYISVYSLNNFLLDLPKPLGLKGRSLGRGQMLQFQKEAAIKASSNNVYYQDVLMALGAKAMNISQEEMAMQSNMMSVEKMRTEYSKHGRSFSIPRSGAQNVVDCVEVFAVSMLQASIRGFLTRKKIRQELEQRKALLKQRQQYQINAYIKKLLKDAEEWREQQVGAQQILQAISSRDEGVLLRAWKPENKDLQPGNGNDLQEVVPLSSQDQQDQFSIAPSERSQGWTEFEEHVNDQDIEIQIIKNSSQSSLLQQSQSLQGQECLRKSNSKQNLNSVKFVEDDEQNL